MSIVTTYQRSHFEYGVTREGNVMAPMRVGIWLVTAINSTTLQRITSRIRCDQPKGD